MVSRELGQLLALQRTDSVLADIARREEDALARLNEEKDRREGFKAQMAEEKKFLDEAMKAHKVLDLDLKKLEEQIKKYSSQMYEVKTNKEYSALKDEIDKGKDECQKTEDKILHLMIKEDELKGVAGRRNGELKEMEAGAARVEEKMKVEGSRMAVEREGLNGQRTEQSAGLSANLLRRYEQIAKFRGGSSLARVVEAPAGGEVACGECHMTIRPQIIVEIYKADELVACEFCGRILYLDSQLTSDHEAGAATAVTEGSREAEKTS